MPRTRGGSNRVSNLTMACKPCNDAKGQTNGMIGHVEIGSMLSGGTAKGAHGRHRSGEPRAKAAWASTSP